jgi:hypothetical protein
MRVTFSAPTSDGGANISSYTATCSDGTHVFTKSGPTSPLVVTGLTKGVSYTCSVTASNTNGPSAVSITATRVAKRIDLTPILMLLLD